ncbi:hypothetical protein BU15DRAFT_65246 [Melanogaster broomeanus]|nr:hypothetical protein BU15DRAFT_65246 [Melanogaster broomeanus]
MCGRVVVLGLWQVESAGVPDKESLVKQCSENFPEIEQRNCLTCVKTGLSSVGGIVGREKRGKIDGEKEERKRTIDVEGSQLEERKWGMSLLIVWGKRMRRSFHEEVPDTGNVIPRPFHGSWFNATRYVRMIHPPEGDSNVWVGCNLEVAGTTYSRMREPLGRYISLCHGTRRWRLLAWSSPRTRACLPGRRNLKDLVAIRGVHENAFINVEAVETAQYCPYYVPLRQIWMANVQ